MEEKSLQEYNKSYPAQLELFQIDDEKYSNTVELYDFLPKYVWGKLDRINGQFLKTIERTFECRGKRYKVEIRPARISKDGEEKEYYPGKREELVEDALRKFATDGQGLFLDDLAGVTFSIYQLQKELSKERIARIDKETGLPKPKRENSEKEKRGHSYSKEQIRNAIMVCARTNITITSEDGERVFIGNLFETVGMNRGNCFVRFNSLVTEAIKKGKFRQINYEQLMSYESFIARQLHKRMSHHFTQASIANKYTISLSTIIRDFGLAEYDVPSLNLIQVEKALEEMKKKEVILIYKIKKTGRGKNMEALIELTPHPFFVSEAKRANALQPTELKIKQLGSSDY